MTADRYNRSDLSSQALKAWQNAHPELAPDHGQPLPPPKLCHDYDKEIPMSDDKLTPQELRGEFAALHTEIADIRTALAAVLDGLRQAASVPVPQGETITFEASRIERTGAKGKHYYRMLGGMYKSFGISIWPEVLEKIGLGKIEFADDDSYTIAPPITVRAEIGDYIAKDGTPKRGPQKIIGLA